MDEIMTLSEDSFRILQQLLDDHRNKVQNTVNRPAVETITAQATSVYMALATNGLPGLVGDVPGVGECGIYRLIPGTQTIGYIGASEVVFNPYATQVLHGDYLAIGKDRFGNWIALGPSVGAGMPREPGTTVDNFIVPYLDVVVEVCPITTHNPLAASDGGTGINMPLPNELLIGNGTGGWTQVLLPDLLDSMGGISGTFGG